MKIFACQLCWVLMLIPFTLSAQENDKRFIFSSSYVLHHSPDYNPSHTRGFKLSASREKDVSDYITLGFKAQLGNLYFSSTHYLDNNNPHSSDNITASSDPAFLVSAGGYVKPTVYQINDLMIKFNIGLQLTYMERSDLDLLYLNSNHQRTHSAKNDHFSVFEFGPVISHSNIWDNYSLHLNLNYNIGPRSSRSQGQTTLRYTSLSLSIGI